MKSLPEIVRSVLSEADGEPVDSHVFRDQFYKLQKSLGPLRENITRDIARLERNKAYIPHVAPAEIKKRKAWLEDLGKIESILEGMMGE